jgi:hypothetical protein
MHGEKENENEFKFRCGAVEWNGMKGERGK